MHKGMLKEAAALYPETIKKALDIESNHNIVINTEKLDKKLASMEQHMAFLNSQFYMYFSR